LGADLAESGERWHKHMLGFEDVNTVAFTAFCISSPDLRQSVAFSRDGRFRDWMRIG